MTPIYGYNNAGRLASLSVQTAQHGHYVYNAFWQLASRTVTTGMASSAVQSAGL